MPNFYPRDRSINKETCTLETKRVVLYHFSVIVFRLQYNSYKGMLPGPNEHARRCAHMSIRYRQASGGVLMHARVCFGVDGCIRSVRF